jgi:hypothetical protein
MSSDIYLLLLFGNWIEIGRRRIDGLRLYVMGQCGVFAEISEYSYLAGFDFSLRATCITDDQMQMVCCVYLSYIPQTTVNKSAPSDSHYSFE